MRGCPLGGSGISDKLAATLPQVSLTALPSSPALGQLHGLPQGDLCFSFSIPGFLSP